MTELWMLVFSIATSLLVFILLRELVCWYFKINRVVTLLESIDKSLKTLAGEHED